MAHNKSVGALGAILDSASGLFLPANVQVDSTAWGAKSCTIPLRLWNRRYPALIPARGDAPPLYRGAADATDVNLSFLGFESERFTRGGKDGIGTMEALYRGAVFPAATPTRTVPWTTKGRTQKSVVIQLYNYDNPGYTAAGQATLAYYSRDITKQYVASTEPSDPFFIPAAATDDDVTTLRVEAFDLNGVPIEDPEFAAYNSEILFNLEDFTIAPCGRFFEVTEKYSSEIVPVTPPITGAIPATEVLIAQGGAYFYNNYAIPPTYFGPAFQLRGSYGPPFSYGPNWPTSTALTVKRIVINVNGGTVTGGISENGGRSDIVFTTPATAALSLSGPNTLLCSHAVAAGNYLILYVDTLTGSPTTFTYSVYATIP